MFGATAGGGVSPTEMVVESGGVTALTCDIVAGQSNTSVSTNEQSGPPKAAIFFIMTLTICEAFMHLVETAVNTSRHFVTIL